MRNIVQSLDDIVALKVFMSAISPIPIVISNFETKKKIKSMKDNCLQPSEFYRMHFYKMIYNSRT